MENCVEVEDISIIELIEKEIDKEYCLIKSEYPLSSSNTRRVARIAMIIISTLKKNVRQAPFNAKSMAYTIPKLIPNTMSYKEEAADEELKAEVDSLLVQAQNMSSDFIDRWTKLSKNLNGLMGETNHLQEPLKLNNLKKYCAIKTHTKLMLSKRIEELKQMNVKLPDARKEKTEDIISACLKL